MSSQQSRILRLIGACCCFAAAVDLFFLPIFRRFYFLLSDTFDSLFEKKEEYYSKKLFHEIDSLCLYIQTELI